MIDVIIDEWLLAKSIAETCIRQGSNHSNIQEQIERFQRFDEMMKKPFTDQSEILRQYNVEFMNDGKSPFTSHLGGLRAIRMTAPIGMVLRENGDMIVYDSGVTFNHSAYIRAMMTGFEEALDNL